MKNGFRCSANNIAAMISIKGESRMRPKKAAKKSSNLIMIVTFSKSVY